MAVNSWEVVSCVPSCSGDVLGAGGVVMARCQWDSDSQVPVASSPCHPHGPGILQPTPGAAFPPYLVLRLGTPSPSHQDLGSPVGLCCYFHLPLQLLTCGMGHTWPSCDFQVAPARGKGPSVRRSCRNMATPTSPRGTCCGPRSAQARSGARSCRPSWRRASWCPW